MSVNVVADQDVVGVVGIGRVVPSELVVTLTASIVVTREFRTEYRGIVDVNLPWSVADSLCDSDGELPRLAVFAVGGRATRSVKVHVCTVVAVAVLVVFDYRGVDTLD